MPATSYGLLAVQTLSKMMLISMVIARWGELYGALAMRMPLKPANSNELQVKRAAENSSAEIVQDSESPFFSLPTRIDDDDILPEYGRFMLSIMNQTMSPCEDFYEYACGNWKNSSLVPPESRNDTFLHAIQHAVDRMMGKYLNETLDEKDEKAKMAEGKAKVFYASCLKQNKNMNEGFRQLQVLEEFTKELKKKDENDTLDWITVNFLSSYSVYPLLPLKVHYDTESRKFDLIISSPTRVFSNPGIVDIKNLTRDFKIEGEKEQKQFNDEFLEMIDFEKNLTAHANRRNETESLKLDDFIAMHKSDALNWTRYFDVAFNGSYKGDWTVHYTMEDVDGLLRFLNRSKLETLRNFVKWRTLLKFHFIWKFQVKDKPVSETCREHTEQYFNYALIPWFIDSVFSDDKRADVYQLAKHIKEVFYDLIDKYTWLDDETKSNAKTKLSSMDVQVGYSDEMRHRPVINHVYQDVNMTQSDWFKNLFILEANRAKVRMRSVNKAIIPPLMSTRDVNAYYADFLNLAFVAVGISQFPFYHIKFPPSLKFGGIANIIAHEMAHGFDSYCYQFNYDGKKQNWWSEASLRNFKERYRCLESQYNKLIYRGVPTNGTMTSGDNIADNVGTRMAYIAYMRNYGNKDGDRKPIPGVSFTNKQLFFVKFAQSWCTGKDDASKMRKIKSDAHAYEEFRVTGTLSNMPEFSEAFKCKLGTDMNPLKKCIVW